MNILQSYVPHLPLKQLLHNPDVNDRSLQSQVVPSLPAIQLLQFQ